MSQASDLLKTPLYDLHVRAGGRLVPFAGYSLPSQYATGVIEETLQTRKAAGLFDVSHMGRIDILPKSGELVDAALALEKLVPSDIAGLKPGRQRYSVFTNPSGGILDDLMIANLGDRLMLIVNAACKEADLAHLTASMAEGCIVEPHFDYGLLALQGPRAESVLATLIPEVAQLGFMHVAQFTFGGGECVVSRSGYTGEDGFEISASAYAVQELADAILSHPDALPIGLGARDTLRLEAGLCLYGADLSTDTSPVEASIEWCIQKARRPGGARPGGYPGSQRIESELAEGPARKRVGLQIEGKMPVRAGSPIFHADDDATPIGSVSSGGFSPGLGYPVAIAYLDSDYVAGVQPLFAEVRGRRVPVSVTPMPFIQKSYKR